MGSPTPKIDDTPRPSIEGEPNRRNSVSEKNLPPKLNMKAHEKGQQVLSSGKEERAGKEEKEEHKPRKIERIKTPTKPKPKGAQEKVKETKEKNSKSRRVPAPHPPSSRRGTHHPKVDSIPLVANPENFGNWQAHSKMNTALKTVHQILSRQEGDLFSVFAHFYPSLNDEKQLEWVKIPPNPSEKSEYDHASALQTILKTILQAYKEGFTEFNAADETIKTADELLKLVLQHPYSKNTIFSKSITLLTIWRQIFLHSKIPTTEIRLLTQLVPSIQAILAIHQEKSHTSDGKDLADYFQQTLATAQAAQEALSPLQPAQEFGINTYVNEIPDKPTRKNLSKSLDDHDLDAIINSVAQGKLEAWQTQKQHLPHALAQTTRIGHALLTERHTISPQFEKDKAALAVHGLEPKRYLPFEELIRNVASQIGNG